MEKSSSTRRAIGSAGCYASQAIRSHGWFNATHARYSSFSWENQSAQRQIIFAGVAPLLLNLLKRRGGRDNSEIHISTTQTSYGIMHWRACGGKKILIRGQQKCGFDASTLVRHSEITNEIKDVWALWPKHPLLEKFSMYTQRDTCKNVPCSTVCHVGKLKITRMHMNLKMDT